MKKSIPYVNYSLVGLASKKDNYTAALKSGGKVSCVTEISEVVIAVGFKGITKADFNGFIEIEREIKNTDQPISVITGSYIEHLMKGRGETGLFEKTPENIAFIQCFGSRDIKENTMYCSRVCCAYSTRAAKVIKKYYPDCKLTFFYMEMQQVKNGDYFDELKQLGVNFIKCRPVKIKDASPAFVTFDNPETGKREELSFDIIVLADGIHPADSAAKTAEVCGLGQTEAGFLRYINGINHADRTGVYIAGCAKGPAKIEEVYADSIAVARHVILGRERP